MVKGVKAGLHAKVRNLIKEIKLPSATDDIDIPDVLEFECRKTMLLAAGIAGITIMSVVILKQYELLIGFLIAGYVFYKGYSIKLDFKEKKITESFVTCINIIAERNFVKNLSPTETTTKIRMAKVYFVEEKENEAGEKEEIHYEFRVSAKESHAFTRDCTYRIYFRPNSQQLIAYQPY